MNFFPQPSLALPDSPKLRAKQGHATHSLKLHSYFRTLPRLGRGFTLSRLSTIQHPRVSVSTPYSCRGRERVEKSKIQNRDALPLTPSPLNPLIPRRLSAAFSLTEVVIAMGVAAVAFTSIIALFPLGLNMSKESYEATQAAVIAQSIMADLSDQASAGSGKLIQKTGTNAMSAANYETIQLMAASGGTDRYIYLAYDQQIRTDSSNSPVMLRPSASFVSLNGPADPNWFTRGTNGPILLVKVSLKHSFRMSAAGDSNPQRVDITIESPASAPATNRVQYVFSGVIPQN
jgi:hypothetical protein